MTETTTTFTRKTAYTNLRDIAIVFNKTNYTLPATATFTYQGKAPKSETDLIFVFTAGNAFCTANSGKTFRTSDTTGIAALPEPEPAAPADEPEKPAKAPRQLKYNYPEDVKSKEDRKAYRRKARRLKKAAARKAETKTE